MPDIENPLAVKPASASQEETQKLSAQPQTSRDVHDWVRDMRMSASVNKTTTGVETDRVTPELLLATSRKLLAINRGEAQEDAKDSLEFQRVYGPAEYFAEHILKDANKVGRKLLWKATNKGNLDFMQSGALDQHVSDVFNNSGLANRVDASSPLESVEASYKISRIGEGGVGDVDSAPDEMRLVQPSFLGYVDPVRSVECMPPEHQVRTDRGWKSISDITTDDNVACWIDGHMQYCHPEQTVVYDYDGWLCCHKQEDTIYRVTDNHRMWVSSTPDGDMNFIPAGSLELSSAYFMADLEDPSVKLKLSDSGYYRDMYRGKVYCLTVPGGVFYTRLPGMPGFWVGNSLKVGLDAYMTKHCMRGTDGKLYQRFINARTGKEELVDSVTAAKSVITTPDMMESGTRNVYATGGKAGIRIVNKKDVDYYLPRMDDAFTKASNLVTNFSGVKELRLVMGCLHPYTTVLCMDAKGMWKMMRAGRLVGSSAPLSLPCMQDDGKSVGLPLRGVHSKFPQVKHCFRKVVLYSGRTVVVTKDHRWATVKDGATSLVTTEKLKPGDRIPRTLFKDVQGRRTFIQPPDKDAGKQLQVTDSLAFLLGVAARTLRTTGDGKAVVTYNRKHREFITGVLERIKSFDPMCTVTFYTSSRTSYFKLEGGWLAQELLELFGDSVANRTIPPCILSAKVPVVLSFLSGYTSDDSDNGLDGMENNWVLNIPNPETRDAIAFLFARTGVDSYYRDGKGADGGDVYALRLLDEIRDPYGDGVLDAVKKVLPASTAAVMVDIDVNDNLYAVANGVVTHNSKYPQQAVSIQGREAPLVRNIDEATGKDFVSTIGRFCGARYTDKPGVVAAVRDGRIDMNYDDGTKGSISLYRNFPMNAKGYINNTPVVKAGMHLNGGDLVASSNYTDDKGVSALGTNLRVGYISWKGGTYEDAIVLSESAAKKMTSDTMYANTMDLDKTVTLGKRNYLSWKPGTYTREQLDNLDDDGIVKPGTVLHKGDPVVLAVRTEPPSPGTMGKRILTDLSETWEHNHPGTVTDVVRTRNGLKVLTTVSAPVEIGDKISNGFGAKGVVSHIYPDDQMPHDKDGKPLEILMSPLGLITRCYDDLTEFLTKDGWKLGKDVAGSDELYCYDPHTDSWHWGRQLAPMHHASYEGEMLGAVADGVDFLVTPNHKVWARDDDPGTSFRETTVREIFGKGCTLPCVASRSASMPDIGGGILELEDKALADQLQSLLAIHGIAATLVDVSADGRTLWRCTIPSHGSSTRHIAPGDWRSVPYKGGIHCPTVDTGYILTRRNGRIVCMGNTNPAQLTEALLGKVAHKTGKYETIPAFYKGDVHQYVKDKLKQANLKADDDFYDPETNRRIPDVLNGYGYFYKLKHMAESKLSDRGIGSYSNDETPGGSGEDKSKRFGGLEQAALVGMNAFKVLEDNKLIRGQSNNDFWRSLRTGQIPVMPGEPLVQRKFFAHLQGAGVNVRKTPKGVSVFALSSRDVDELAGPRELKSADTYEVKNFRPIDGGLFGQDVFGINGDKWGFIKVDEPVPNPVMEKPMARLLNLSDKDFTAICRGEKEIDGMKSSKDIKDRLSKIDLGKEASKAKEEFKNATGASKDKALKRYVAIERMRRLGNSPDQYMLDKIPVLPPVYRPISSHGGLTMVADANYLYKQLLEARDDIRDAADLPKEYQDKARANLQDKWQELTGMYDVENPKLKSKNVGGLLQWALGKGSPKFSAAQRKVIGNNVDTVGRGVIIPDAHQTVDEIGIPVRMAFGIMAPFVERALAKRGYTPIAAMKMVKEQSPQALDILQETMKTHPVIMNRAPTLHKYNMMAFKPHLVQGEAIKVHPSICPGFAADFDGDTISNLTRIVVDLNILKEKVKKIGTTNLTTLEAGLYSALLPDKVPGSSAEGTPAMISADTKCMFATATGSLSELPVVEGSEVVKSSTVTEWDVQDGFYTDTVDPATGAHGLAKITKVSRHTGLKMLDCVLSSRGSYQHVVTASEDHSLITLDDELKLVKTRPQEAVGRMVPVVLRNAGNDWSVCAKYIHIDKDYAATGKLGYLIGVILGDGWVDAVNCLRIACCHEGLKAYLLDLLKVGNSPIDLERDAQSWSYATTDDRFSQHDAQRISVYASCKLKKALKGLIGTGAEHKRIPEDCLMASRTHLWGLLSGLLATDGTVSYSECTKSKKSACKSVMVHTISPLLRDGIQELCRRLGIRTGATPYKGAHSLSTCYAVTLSLQDLSKALKAEPGALVMHHKEKDEALAKIIREIENSTSCMEFDIVPFPSSMRCEFIYAGVNAKGTKYANLYNLAIKSGYIGRSTALEMTDVMESVDWSTYHEKRGLAARQRTHHTPDQAKRLVDSWVRLVRDNDVHWEHVDSASPSSCTEGWDCTVPGPYTFTLSTGTVVQDTVNIHVPVSDNARKEALDKMLPSRNLMSVSGHDIMNKPEKEYAQGLYIATRMGTAPGGRAQIFSTLEDARAAYRKGAIDVDTPINILNPGK